VRDVATRRADSKERLHAVVELGKRAAPPTATELRPFLRDKTGIVVAAAARIAAENRLQELERDLEEAFLRFLDDPAKTDPGCRAKLATAEALRSLDVRAPDVYLRGVAFRQLEPTYGPPLDTAAPVRVCCAAALLETRHPLALLEVAPLLADPEANTRAGVATVLGQVGGETCEALLRLKARIGDAEPEVVGACLQGLLAASFERALPFVLSALSGGDEAVRRLALLALGESRDERALPPLREAVEHDPEQEVRCTALLALAISRLPAAHEYLLQAVEGGSERLAIDAVGAIASARLDAALADRLDAIARARGGAVHAVLQKKTQRA
jgi:hypothetical protein